LFRFANAEAFDLPGTDYHCRELSMLPIHRPPIQPGEMPKKFLEPLGVSRV
jgi:hypothetical protein